MTAAGTAAPSADGALAVVGLPVEQVRRIVRAAAEDGAAYLVGSLASGFGNATSDVDVHVLRPGLGDRVGPVLSFAGAVPVDVEQFPAEWPAEVVRRAAEHPPARFGPAVVSPGPAPDRRERRWLSRWVHAVPLDGGTPPVFDEAGTASVLPLLVRSALDQLLRYAALAELAEDGGPDDAAAFLWQRAARTVLELRCRAAGEVTSGEKWLSARLRRLGIDARGPVRDRAGFRSTAEESRLPEWDALRVLRVRPAAGAERDRLAGRRYLRTRHDRLLPDWSGQDRPLAEAVDEFGARRLLDAVLRAESDLAVDEDALREVLT